MKKLVAILCALAFSATMVAAEDTNVSVLVKYYHAVVQGSNAVPARSWFTICADSTGEHICHWDSGSFGYAEPALATLYPYTTDANYWEKHTNNPPIRVATNEIPRWAKAWFEELLMDVINKNLTNKTIQDVEGGAAGHY